jgi:beta-glucosidase
VTDRDHAPAQRETGARTGQATQPWYEDGRLHFAVGIEDTFIPQGFPGRRKLDEYELTQHYHLWHSDLGLAAAAGAEMVRWGIPWYLIEPSPAGSAGAGWTESSTASPSSA